MQRLPVESSDIVSIGYDPKARLLEIEFKENRIYRYQEVEPDVYHRFMRADSFGQYFFASINGRYRYSRADESGKRQKPQTIAFVTGNVRKVRDLQIVCAAQGIEVEHVQLPVDEVQSYDPEEVAVKKAKRAYKLAGRPVVIHDTFWNIMALRGFPGAYMSYVAGWFKAEDFLRLMDGKTDRTVGCTDTLVYHDGQRSKVFTQDLWGNIATEARGSGPSIDRIVVAAGETKTIAEVETEEGRSCIDPDNSVWSDFAKWYSLQRKIGRA
jgi:XTP/dITP diphosphohydrolase